VNSVDACLQLFRFYIEFYFTHDFFIGMVLSMLPSPC